MDEFQALHLSPGAWWRVGVFGAAVWVFIAFLEGSSTLALAVVPMLVLLWTYAIFAIDRWVSSGRRSEMPPRSCHQ